jgi:recombination protein RecT
MSNLRDRARGGGEVAVRDATALKAQVRKMEAQFQLAMPRGMEAKQLVRDFETVLRATPKLAECDPITVLGALMTCSQLGLRPGVLGQAWVLPFGGKAQLIIGYKGYASLAQRTASIADITARIIRENDEFDYEFGLNERLVHRPNLLVDRGDPVAYYSVVRTNTGGKYWELMSVREVEEHRDKFAMQRKWGTAGPGTKGIVTGPWIDHPEAMAKKTVVIKALNLAPASTALQHAFDVDGSTRFDLSPKADVREVSVIEDDGRDADDAVIDEDTPTDPAEPTDAEWDRIQGEQKS